MQSPQEQETVSTIESLFPRAAQVFIGFVDGGWYGQGDWLEFRGDGKAELRELAERFGEKGVDAFSQAFVTPEFEQGIEARVKNLTQDIIDAADEILAPDVNYIRNKWAAERSLLQELLRGIRGGEEVQVLLGDKHYIQRGRNFGNVPEEGTVSIALKRSTKQVVA